MPTNPRPGTTDFSRDVLGRYVCNGLDEALRSRDPAALRPDGRPQVEARDFDLIVIGGGTFGAVIAEHMSFRDRSRSHRTLVLEGGPVVLPEHVQNLPMLGLDVPSPTSIADLEPDPAKRKDIQARNEVWGLAWHSSVPFPGLAYCMGGRSLYWGGWSPEPLSTEFQPGQWPAAVVNELVATALPSGHPGYFRQASQQIGTSETNDFIFGELQRAMRAQLFDGVTTKRVTDAVMLAALPDHPAVRFAASPPTPRELANLLGTATPGNVMDMKNELKLEAPLAVQGRSGHAGFFPFNKFSSVPLLIKAAREAFGESGTDDARKRIMIVPNCHVIALNSISDGNEWRVTDIVTNQGTVQVPVDGKVVIALGTIESTRLVKNSFNGKFNQAAWDRVGTNLVAHLRSNLNIRIPRTALTSLPPTVNGLQAAALFVKGQHKFQDGSVGHFHLQITASGLGAVGANSEAELFKKIPDIDTYEAHRNANDTHVAITIRGIGEMQTQNPDNRITLDGELDEYQSPRAFVRIANPRDPQVRAANPQSAKDFELWNAMDQAAVDVAKVLGVAQPPQPAPDGLGTTHHEAGPLFLGEAASTSVTLPDCRLRHTKNTYVAGPALFPTSGSPNPMLTGVALARRLGDALAASTPWQPDTGFTALFDGMDISKWRMTTIRNQPGRDNPGRMRIIDGALETVAGNDMGIFWCTVPTHVDFILKLQWLRWTADSNSGVYVRFPDPETKGYNNTAFVADDFGFEAQIDEFGAPDGLGIHKTGAIYRKDNRTDNEVLTQKPARNVGEWNDYEIHVEGQKYTVTLNGDRVCIFDNTNLYPLRGKPSAPGAPSYIGLQVYANPRHLVRFRRIQMKQLP
jgi:choline dehydrogenase-like flavoprotein